MHKLILVVDEKLRNEKNASKLTLSHTRCIKKN
jgi:hypothetical protein